MVADRRCSGGGYLLTEAGHKMLTHAGLLIGFSGNAACHRQYQAECEDKLSETTHQALLRLCATVKGYDEDAAAVAVSLGELYYIGPCGSWQPLPDRDCWCIGCGDDTAMGYIQGWMDARGVVDPDLRCLLFTPTLAVQAIQYAATQLLGVGKDTETSVLPGSKYDLSLK